MTRKHVLPIALVLAALVGGYTWWRGHRSDADPAAPAAGSGIGPRFVGPIAKPDTRPSTFARMVDDDPRGALQLKGQVIDANDKPVAHATVLLSANPPRAVTTEDDGTFAFE